MKFRTLSFIAVCIVLVTFFTWHLLTPSTPSLSEQGALGKITPPSAADFEARTFFESSEFMLTRQEGIHMRYVDETYHFSFELFSGFRAAEGTLRSGRYVITVENDTGVWMLIVVSPFDGTVPVLTKEMIVADVQDITISNDEPFSISGVTGLLFDSTDPLWDGNARELWFVEGGYLYQLSTKREWQALLVESARSWRKESL